LAIAKRFAAEGARLLLADRNGAAVEETAIALGQQSMVVDVSIEAEVEAMISQAETSLGRVDILVINAGVLHRADLLELTESDFDRVIAVNLKSVLFAIQAAAPRMISRKSGLLRWLISAR
jgi:3-oxoacyl-[acyl-carrier protein] reductase